MSLQNFVRAIELAKKCEFYTIAGEKSEEVVLKAEELFGYKFSKQNFQFFKHLGYLSFFGCEIFGIIKDDFSGKYTGCAIEAALSDRKSNNLPAEWLPIYYFDDGYMGYLDYGQLNDEGEPPVIMSLYNGERYEAPEKVAEDFGDFLLQVVSTQLSRQRT